MLLCLRRCRHLQFLWLFVLMIVVELVSASSYKKKKVNKETPQKEELKDIITMIIKDLDEHHQITSVSKDFTDLLSFVYNLMFYDGDVDRWKKDCSLMKSLDPYNHSFDLYEQAFTLHVEELIEKDKYVEQELVALLAFKTYIYATVYKTKPLRVHMACILYALFKANLKNFTEMKQFYRFLVAVEQFFPWYKLEPPLGGAYPIERAKRILAKLGSAKTSFRKEFQQKRTAIEKSSRPLLLFPPDREYFKYLSYILKNAKDPKTENSKFGINAAAMKQEESKFNSTIENPINIIKTLEDEDSVKKCGPPIKTNPRLTGYLLYVVG